MLDKSGDHEKIRVKSDHLLEVIRSLQWFNPPASPTIYSPHHSTGINRERPAFVAIQITPSGPNAISRTNRFANPSLVVKLTHVAPSNRYNLLSLCLEGIQRLGFVPQNLTNILRCNSLNVSPEKRIDSS